MPIQYSALQNDPEIYAAIIGEQKRQQAEIQLIASENYMSQAVLEALSSHLANRYAEGYPGKRYYSGQEFTDQVETLAQERAKKLFGCQFANVQPLSGAPANTATYFALMEPGDTILGMDLSHGGHLTHGHPVTYLSKIFNFVRYKMKDPKENAGFDFDEILAIAKKEKPKVILCGYSAYSRDLNYEQFKKIADEVGAYAVADVAHIAGLISASEMKNPFDFGFDVVLMTTHKTLRGPRGGMILSNDEATAKKIDKMVFPGFQGGPHMNQIASKAVAFGEALKPEYKEYCQQIRKNISVMAEELQKADFDLVTGGTDNHLLLVDLRNKKIGGHELADALGEAGIVLNKNMIPDDPSPPMRPSGVRLGSPAMTTRGVKEEGFVQIAKWIAEVAEDINNKKKLAEIKKAVEEFCSAYPVPGV